MNNSLQLFFELLVIFIITLTISGFIFYPLVKNNTYIINNKYYIFVISLILFIAALFSYLPTVEYNPDVQNNKGDMSLNLLKGSFVALSVSTFLILFVHKK